MKTKVIILLCIVMCALQVKAQKILVDHVNEKGMRIISVQNTWFKSHFFQVRETNIALGLDAVDDMKYLNIVIYSYDTKYTFPQNGKILIKTANGDVLSHDILVETTMDFIATEWNSTIKEYIDKYRGSLNIPLSEEELQKIITQGIVKIRIEVANSKYIEEEKDMTKRKDKNKVEEITEWLRNSYNMINDKLSNPPVDISDDF